MDKKPLERLKKKITIENLWIYILSLLEERPMYAYEIRDKIQEKFNFRAGRITAYVVLYKLEKDSYVKTEWKERGRQRKYYRITKSGKRLLKNGISILEEMIREIKQ